MVFKDGLRPAGSSRDSSLGQLRNIDIFSMRVAEKSLSSLMDFKARERKDDPERRHGIHGPYEEANIRKKGRLPGDYYTAGDAEPWGLRVPESRSNILWQVLSGIMDRHVEYGTAYMALALDTSLSDDEYARELRKTHASWGSYLEHATEFNDHHHSAMSHTYTRVACPACSMLTALAAQDAGMQSVFKEMLSLKSADDRRRYLSEQGLMPLLDTMIPDQKPALKL